MPKHSFLVEYSPKNPSFSLVCPPLCWALCFLVVKRFLLGFCRITCDHNLEDKILDSADYHTQYHQKYFTPDSSPSCVASLA